MTAFFSLKTQNPLPYLDVHTIRNLHNYRHCDVEMRVVKEFTYFLYLPVCVLKNKTYQEFVVLYFLFCDRRSNGSGRIFKTFSFLTWELSSGMINDDDMRRKFIYMAGKTDSLVPVQSKVCCCSCSPFSISFVCYIKE